VYVAPRMDAEVLRQAATEVMSANQAVADIKLEATQFASQTQSEAERIVAQAQASAERVVASTQVEASQALLNQEKQLRQTFEARERELLQRIQELSNSVAVVHQDNRDQTATDMVTLSHRIDQLAARMDSFDHQVTERMSRLEAFSQRSRVSLDQLSNQLPSVLDFVRKEMGDLNERLAKMEEWYDQPAPHEEDDELVPPFSPVGHSPQNVQSTAEIGFQLPSQGFGLPSNPTEQAVHAPHVPPGTFTPLTRSVLAPSVVDEHEDRRTLEEQCISFKEAASVKFPPLPERAGALRHWKNTLIPMLNSLDKSAEGRVYTWLMQAFNATTPEAIADLAASSGDFPKLDRMLCSWLTRNEALKGHFGPRIQAFVEHSLS